MSLSTVAHLNFTGDARRALEFYQSVFGGQLMIATYGDVGVPHDAPDADHAVFDRVEAGSPDADHVAFGMVATDDGFRIAAYDVYGGRGGRLAGADSSSGRVHGLTHGESFFLLLNGGSLDEVAGPWEKLADGGTVIQALAPADWAPAYGMLTDRFGVTWIFGITPG